MAALYHSHPECVQFTAEVVKCEAVAGQEGLYCVELSDTAFYPTGGGQPCDLGELDGCPVVDVTHEGDEAPILHFVRSGRPLSGNVVGRIDAERRRDHTQQHSGQHLISHVMYERYGAYSLGLHIGREDSYVDLVDDGSFRLTREVCDDMERQINEWIARDEPVRCFFPTREELADLPLRKKPDAHEALRIVCIGEDEAVACCGTHVRSTAQVQMVHILSWQQSHGNLRIFFVAGMRAVRYAAVRIAQADAAAKLLSCNVAELAAAVERLKAQGQDTARQLGEARKALVECRLAALEPEGLAQGNLYVAVLDGADDAQLRDGISAVTRKDPMAVCFLAAPAGEQYAAALGTGAQCAVHAGNALKAVLSALGGKGGGRPDCAFGRCARMDDAAVRGVLRAMMD